MMACPHKAECYIFCTSEERTKRATEKPAEQSAGSLFLRNYEQLSAIGCRNNRSIETEL
jgi:hypothetical protein